MRFFLVLVSVVSVAALGCGDDSGSANDGGLIYDGDGSLLDGDGSVIPPPVTFDGGVPGGESCSPTSTECNNCIDDDGDGLVDGADFECISPLDDDEASFATGIPGDNKDAKKQDCFFDGDSGAGNDGCDIPICCLLGDCMGAQCELTDMCKENCGALTPPGCDCFGCCTLCDGAECHDILINPGAEGNKDCTSFEDYLQDNSICQTCTKQESCGPVDCALDNDCILCPGEPLPPECEEAACPDGQTVCETNTDCLNNEYCSQGCCNEGFIVQ